MNLQKPPHGIEWTRIKRTGNNLMAGGLVIDTLYETLPGYTWNPTAGCLHGCTWRMPDGSTTECYAKTVAEGVARKAYPDGFEHHYWHPGRLQEPLKLRKPAGIFVGSMADLFGHWVPQEQIEAVFNTMMHAHWHTFQVLTKYPNRMSEPWWPKNIWAGVSLPAGHMMSATGAARALAKYLGHMRKVRARTRFMSIEPLWFDVATVFERWLAYGTALPFEWAIIGAASKGRKVYQPDPQHVRDLLAVLDAEGIPVFFKGNMEWAPWREEFPQ